MTEKEFAELQYVLQELALATKVLNTANDIILEVESVVDKIRNAGSPEVEAVYVKELLNLFDASAIKNTMSKRPKENTDGWEKSSDPYMRKAAYYADMANRNADRIAELEAENTEIREQRAQMSLWKDRLQNTITRVEADLENLADQMENEGPTNRTWNTEVMKILDKVANY